MSESVMSSLPEDCKLRDENGYKFGQAINNSHVDLMDGAPLKSGGTLRFSINNQDSIDFSNTYLYIFVCQIYGESYLNCFIFSIDYGYNFSHVTYKHPSSISFRYITFIQSMQVYFESEYLFVPHKYNTKSFFL